MPILIIKDDILKKCLDKWGIDSQVDLAIEEIGELIEQLGKTISSINKYKRGRIKRYEVLEECVDVFFMMQQIRIVDPKTFDKISEYKLLRLEEILNKKQRSFNYVQINLCTSISSSI